MFGAHSGTPVGRTMAVFTLVAVGSTIIRAEPVNCQAATAVDEIAICNDEDLRTMDGELDRAYRAAGVRWTASMSNSVKAMHQDWLEQRRNCGADRKCLLDRMVEQITALDKMRPRSPTWILERRKRPD